jgi:CheY-like chemotaxis protein
MRILAVEDDADIRDFYRSFLREEGHEALLAADGRQALELARQKPDAIVLDLGLPEMDGYQVLERLRSDPDTRDIPVIIVTAYPLAKGVDLAGVSGVLRKPYDVPLLALTLARAVAAR